MTGLLWLLATFLVAYVVAKANVSAENGHAKYDLIDYSTFIKNLDDCLLRIESLEKITLEQAEKIHLQDARIEELEALTGRYTEINLLKQDVEMKTDPSNDLEETTLSNRGVKNITEFKNATSGGVQESEYNAEDARTDEKRKERDLYRQNLVRRGRRALPVSHVAFTAYLSHDLNHVGVGHIIPFDKTLLNDGNAYNGLTGVFTCPQTGVYLFTFSVNNLQPKQLNVRLVVDGADQLDAISEPAKLGQDIMATITAIVRVSRGQSAWVTITERGDETVHSAEIFRVASFSGVLLYT